MASFLGGLGRAFKGGRNFLFGSKGRMHEGDLFGSGQRDFFNQLLRMLQGENEGFSRNPLDESAERNAYGLLSDDDSAYADYERPSMRQFNEQTVPGLAERFTSEFGGTNNSGFRNAALREGSNLAERLRGQRASLQQSARQDLLSRGQGLRREALTPNKENIYQKGSQGALSDLLRAYIGSRG